MTDRSRDDGQDVDAIRDILFGRQMRDYDQRFAQVEADVAEQLGTLRGGVDERIEQLRAEADRLLDEQKQALTAELGQLNEDLNTARQQLVTSMTEQLEDLREGVVSRSQLAEVLRDLADQIERK